jgi:hypothetical protein
MKYVFIPLVLLVCYADLFGQTLYFPNDDARWKIDSCIQLARQTNRHVLIQAGGNWCAPCLAFASLCRSDAKIDSLIQASYIWYHLNWSEGAENKDVFKRLDYPQRFGFPVFIILNAQGRRIHTQNSIYLENQQRKFDRNRVLDFLEMWTPRVVSPAMYGD